jgi:chloramphenicol 3-O phosphotransferase
MVRYMMKRCGRYFRVELRILIAALSLLVISGCWKGKSEKNSIKPGLVVVLNGPSSVGKTSIVKVFQSLRAEPWLSIGLDNFFVGVIPSKFYLEDSPEHRKVMQGVASFDKDNKPVFTLTLGEQGQRIMQGMHRSIAAYARMGNNVIVDYIMYDPAWRKDFEEIFKGIKVLWVGVKAPLSVIEEREKKRGTSPLGHARSHYDTVHRGIKYDLELDTVSQRPEAAARAIGVLVDTGGLRS